MRSATLAAIWRLPPLIAAIAALISLLNPLKVASQPETASSCLNQTCGRISGIRYPFTLTTNNATCASFPTDHSYFQLFCEETTETLYMLPDPVYPNSTLITLPVTEILNDSLIVDFSQFVAIMETSADGNVSNCSYNFGPRNVILPPVGTGPYVLSDENDFGSFGCSTGYLSTADVKGFENSLYYSDHASVGGCSVLFPDNVNNPRCDNETCCIDSLPPATDVPTRYASFYVDYTMFTFNQTDPSCSCDNNYATIFHPNYTDFQAKSFGVKVKWALPSPNFNHTEKLVQEAGYACAGQAESLLVPEVEGYLCYCKEGFVGDGYAQGIGCSDLDECSDPSLHNCVSGSTCVNTNGSYTCHCDSRFHVGDGHSDGTGCKLSPSFVKAIISVSSIFGVLLIVGIIIIFLALWIKRVKQQNFVLNGGFELQEFMKNAGHDTMRMYTAKQLKEATNNYADNMKLGTGGFGAVYKGKLEDGKLVAIKKSIKLENADNAQFLNEISILTKINHKHIVRLLGCCLETKSPLLVYEFVSNGTLDENIERRDGAVMTWDQRLKVAIQTSEALAYLHRAASPPILHRDVKSANVLLDENWDVKVADFGVSRLVPDGTGHVSTAVQGTLGYLDPEYFQTLQLTDKSDVYSFGVLLVELLTTLKPVDSHHREPQFSNLALLFIHHMKEGRLEEIIDPRLEMIDSQNVSDVDYAWRIRSSLMSVAALAHRCLALMGRDRPSMVEVEHELHRISKLLYATNVDSVEEGSSLLPYEAGAVTIENNEYIIQSSSSYTGASLEDGNKFQVSTLAR